MNLDDYLMQNFGAQRHNDNPLPNDPPPSAPPSGPDPYDNRDKIRGQISGAYTKYLGRGVGEPEYSSWMRQVHLPGPNRYSWDFTAPDWESQIQNSAEAQAYKKNAPASTQGYDLNKLRSTLLAYNVPASAEALAKFISENSAFAHGVTIGGSKKNKLWDPSGKYLADVIRGTSGPSPAWDWDESTGGGAPGGSAGPGPEFDDHWGSEFERAVQNRLASLNNDPLRAALTSYVDRLMQADKAKQANVGKFVESLKSRVSDLQKPAYTDEEDMVIRTKAFDQLERRRTETLKNRREDLYARGHAPTSGTIIGAEDEVNQAFEGSRGQVESDLLRSAIDENQRRQDKAIGLEQLVEQALSGGDLASLQMMAQAAEIEDAQIQDRNQREREILSTLSLPLDLMSQRQQLANQTLGLGASPQSIMQSIMGILGFNQNQRQLQLQSNANNMQGLGQLLAILFPSGR